MENVFQIEIVLAIFTVNTDVIMIYKSLDINEH